MSPTQEAEQLTYLDSLDPAKIARDIAEYQGQLLITAKDKTEQLYLSSLPSELPDIRRGIRVKAS